MILNRLPLQPIRLKKIQIITRHSQIQNNCFLVLKNQHAVENTIWLLWRYADSEQVQKYSILFNVSFEPVHTFTFIFFCLHNVPNLASCMLTLNSIKQHAPYIPPCLRYLFPVGFSFQKRKQLRDNNINW